MLNNEKSDVLDIKSVFSVNLQKYRPKKALFL